LKTRASTQGFENSAVAKSPLAKQTMKNLT